MVVATGLHLEAEAAVFANRRCLGYIVQLDELDGVPQRPTAAVAHRHVARHLNDRHLVDERLGVAPVDPVLVLKTENTDEKKEKYRSSLIKQC